MHTLHDLVRQLKSATLRSARRLFVSNERKNRQRTRGSADEQRIKETLASMGAPLVGVTPQRHQPLELALVRALELARHDGTVFRVLPLVLLRSEEELDWQKLFAAARERDMIRELGLLATLAAKLADRPTLAAKVVFLKGSTETPVRYYPEVRSSFERRLAEDRSPDVARDWGFHVNVSEESLRSTIMKHGV